MSAGTGSRSAQPSTPSGIRACLRSCSTVRIGAHHCRSHRGAQASAECGRCGRRFGCAGRCVLVLHGLARAVPWVCAICAPTVLSDAWLCRRCLAAFACFGGLWSSVLRSPLFDITIKYAPSGPLTLCAGSLMQPPQHAEQPTIWNAYQVRNTSTTRPHRAANISSLLRLPALHAPSLEQAHGLQHGHSSIPHGMV